MQCLPFLRRNPGSWRIQKKNSNTFLVIYLNKNKPSQFSFQLRRGENCWKITFHLRKLPGPELIRLQIPVVNSFLFWACIAENFSLTDSDESKTNLALQSWKPTFLSLKPCFHAIFCLTTFNCNISLAVRDFDLIPRLRAKPKYQLSYGTKLPG